MVAFTSTITNAKTFLNLSDAGFDVHNVSASAFVVQGYQQTLEYQDGAERRLDAVRAACAYDADGNLIPETTLLQLQYSRLFPSRWQRELSHPANQRAGRRPSRPAETATGPGTPRCCFRRTSSTSSSTQRSRAACARVVTLRRPVRDAAVEHHARSTAPSVTVDIDDIAAQLHIALDPTRAAGRRAAR